MRSIYHWSIVTDIIADRLRHKNSTQYITVLCTTAEIPAFCCLFLPDSPTLTRTPNLEQRYPQLRGPWGMGISCAKGHSEQWSRRQQGQHQGLQQLLEQLSCRKQKVPVQIRVPAKIPSTGKIWVPDVRLYTDLKNYGSVGGVHSAACMALHAATRVAGYSSMRD